MQSHSAQIKTEEFFNKVTVCLPGITLTCLRLRRHHQPARIACWAMRLVFLFRPQPQAGAQIAKPATVSSCLFPPLRPKPA